MKKWLDDLHAILFKRGFKTLDNVLKTQLEDFEGIPINDDPVIIKPNKVYTIDISNYFNVYDRFMFYNRGISSDYNFIIYLYKYNDSQSYMYSTQNNSGGAYTISIQSNRRYIDIRNVSSDDLEFDLYVKKIC